MNNTRRTILSLAVGGALVLGIQTSFAQPYGPGYGYGGPGYGYGGPGGWNNGPSFSSNMMPWGGNNYNRRGPWGGNNWGGNNMPWGNSNFMPWGGNNWGGNNMPWGGNNWGGNNWGPRGNPWGTGPGGWTDPSDPRGSMSRAWDDMLDAPNRMGTMPGGWRAPSISVPNPVDVADEFEEASREFGNSR